MSESYQFILKMLRKRLPPTLSNQGELNKLSIAELLNLIFALYGNWGTVGDFSTNVQSFDEDRRRGTTLERPTVPQSVSELVQ